MWLQLEHVFGYNGPKNIQPNVFYTASGEVLYYTSAVGILYMPSENKQKFYLGHEDEISCLTLHPVRSAFYPHDKTINIATRAVCLLRVIIMFRIFVLMWLLWLSLNNVHADNAQH